MGLFLAVGILGFMFFATSAIVGHHDFGHDHDVGHDHGGHEGSQTGPSMFSVFCIAWTMMGFGAVGAFARYFDFSMPSSTASGSLAGALLWFLAFQVMSFMYGQQGDSLVTSAQIINQTGRLTMAIHGDNMGKMTVHAAVATELIVTSSDDIPSGTLVKVVSGSGGIYYVEPVKEKK